MGFETFEVHRRQCDCDAATQADPIVTEKHSKRQPTLDAPLILYLTKKSASGLKKIQYKVAFLILG